MKECNVCLGLCVKEVHEATLRVRAWLREQVTMDRTVKPGKRTNVPDKLNAYIPLIPRSEPVPDRVDAR